MYSVRPDNKYRLSWDLYILVLVVYSSVQGPFAAAFKVDQEASLLTLAIDLSFWCDIVLNFWTGYDKGFEVIMDKGPIVKHYLGGWFFIDFIATVEWDYVVSAFESSQSDSPVVRLMRLLKVLRIARASRLINRLTATWTVHTAFIEATKFFFYVFMVGHLLACFFYMWPTLMTCGRDKIGVPLETVGWDEEGLMQRPSFAADVLADAGFVTDDSLASGEGWFYSGTCMQGSWRQGYGLEQICELKKEDGLFKTLPFEDPEDFAILEECYVAAQSKGHEVVRLLENSGESREHVSQVCVRCMSPMRSYIDSLYWSLTTMTTIGYGDRGPATEDEILFVLFAEVFGLCIFALLLTQINTLGEVVGETEAKRNDEKNGVVQFLKNQHLSNALVEETVRFLNFRASSLSGHAFDEEHDDFSMLSPGLIESIQNAVYRPVLERVRFFGWNKEDELEHDQVKKMFDDIDTDGGGSLDKAETSALFKKLQIALTDEQYEQVFGELDRGGDGDVSFEEFQRWWFLKKNGASLARSPDVFAVICRGLRADFASNFAGKPRMNRCPSAFLDALCTKLKTQPFAIREEMIHPGEYGKSLVIILAGTVKVYRDISEFPVGMPDGDRPEDKCEEIGSDDREPIVGFASCLNTSQWSKVHNRTSDWVVHAQVFLISTFLF